MTVEHPLSRAKGKAGLFWAANHAGGPVKILDGDAPVLVFVNGYLFAHAVGMKEKYGDPFPRWNGLTIPTLREAGHPQYKDALL